VFQVPATFALRDEHADRAETVLAVGMTLPDGGAVTVDWRSGHAGTVGTWSSPQAAAAAHHAELVWYTRPGAAAPPVGPPNGGLWRSS
jgi:hypothetical protein